MFDLRYHYCKRHMTAYLDGDLPPNMRRRIARYIDTNPRCAALYRQQRAVSRDLAATLPAFGRADARDLDRLWASIQAEMQPRQPVRVRQPFRLRYAVGALVLFALVWIPLLAANDPAAAIAPATQPNPIIQVAATTQLPDEIQASDDPQLAQKTENVGAAGPVATAVPPGTPPPAGFPAP